MGSINALPNYTSYFNLPENGNASTGIVFAIFQVILESGCTLTDTNNPRSDKCAVHSSSG